MNMHPPLRGLFKPFQTYPLMCRIWNSQTFLEGFTEPSKAIYFLLLFFIFVVGDDCRAKYFASLGINLVSLVALKS